MTQAFSRAPVPAPPGAAAQDERLGPRFFRVSVDVLRRELESLRLDEEGLSFWASLPAKQVQMVLTSGLATRAQIRRLRRGLRLAWMDYAAGRNSDEDLVAYRRLTLAYLSDEFRRKVA